MLLVEYVRRTAFMAAYLTVIAGVATLSVLWYVWTTLHDR